jgi:DNA-binding CsgD family transcriptional regulator
MTHKKSPQPTVLRYQSAGRQTVGLILLDAQMKPLYLSSTAREILCDGQGTQASGSPEDQLSRRIQSVLVPSGSFGKPASTLLSGRRRYLCRILVLEPTGAAPKAAHSAILLERISRRNELLRRLVQDFKLTPRERQTLQLVVEGLTSKEIASKMDISPHTVRAFLHFIMVKLGVTTRSGIVGKVKIMFKLEGRDF